jgi:hypothetical protein
MGYRLAYSVADDAKWWPTLETGGKIANDIVGG